MLKRFQPTTLMSAKFIRFLFGASVDHGTVDEVRYLGDLSAVANVTLIKRSHNRPYEVQAFHVKL